jgi:broad specificity phosphatase PhoE
MPDILIIRHAESVTNRDGIWNGRIESSLTPEGEASLEALHDRFSHHSFDVVLSSPLDRARRTAAAIAAEYEVEDDLVEMDLGQWEGKTYQDVIEQDGDLFAEVMAGRDVRLGGDGETVAEVSARVWAAIQSLVDRLGPKGRGVIVTHGGVMQGVLDRYLKGRRRRTHAFVANTSVTRLTGTEERPRLASFNDVGHLGPRSRIVSDQLAAGRPVLALVRHGQTIANIEGRWQGQADSELNELGHRQAAALRDWYGTHPTVYASPLGRAQSTAGYLAENGIVTVDGLMELAMGSWEGLTSPEITERWPELMDTIYKDGIDLRRGGDGESWGEMTHRFANTIHGLEPAGSGLTVVVAHGGAIRAYVSSLTGSGDSHGESLYTPPNTSVTHVAITEEGPLLLDYAVATHLEGLS